MSQPTDREAAAREIFRAAVLLVGADDFRWMHHNIILEIKQYARDLNAKAAYLTAFENIYGKGDEAHYSLTQAIGWAEHEGIVIPGAKDIY